MLRARTPADRRASGQAFEARAEALLSRHGLTPVCRNWQCRFGEIDLVMHDGATLVFVEVRQRDRSRFGAAAASIGNAKRERLRRAISMYLGALAHTPPCRVDAVLFDGDSAPEWLRDVLGERD